MALRLDHEWFADDLLFLDFSDRFLQGPYVAQLLPDLQKHL